MKITVDRTITKDRELIFTITCSEPTKAPFTMMDEESLEFLEECKINIQNLGNPEAPLNSLVCSAIHNIKRQTFDRVRNQMTHSIRKDIECKIHHICQEVYNWLYDEQPAYLLKWMNEFDPQRTKFYFSNDGKLEQDDEDEDN